MNFFRSLFRKFGIFTKLLGFLWEKKIWWLIPLIIILVVFTLIIIFGRN